MSKNLTISPELMKNKDLEIYKDFIFGFIDNMNWTITDEGNVILFSVRDNIDSLKLYNYDYIILLSEKDDVANADFEVSLIQNTRDYYSIWIDNNNIYLDIYIKNTTTLFKYESNKVLNIKSKSLKNILNQYKYKSKSNQNIYVESESLESFNINDFDLGKYISIIISDSCIADEFKKKRVG